MKKTNTSSFQRAPLKWAGGKTRVLPHLLKLLPPGKKLIEPFLGSGIVFLNTDYQKYLLNDHNPDLINFYQTLQKQGHQFIKLAQGYFTAQNNQEDNYYKKRYQFNTTVDPLEKALLFLYLNRHGYNGLCRYNKQGEYNVPFGHYKKQPYFPEQELYYFHQKSKKAQFTCVDFTLVLKRCRVGQIIYCDPPYVPLTATSAFTQYYTAPFEEHHQDLLTQHAKRLASKGIPVIISNQDTPYTQQAYQTAQQHIIKIPRLINCQGNKRHQVKEVLAIFS